MEGRGGREWTDLDAAFLGLMSKGVDDAIVGEETINCSQAEKAIGKKTFAELADDM